MEQNPQSQLKLLVTRGKEQGYLTYAEVNDHLPEDIVDSDQIEDIIQMINDMGIQVMEEAPDADDLMLAENTADEDAAEAAAQVLSCWIPTVCCVSPPILILWCVKRTSSVMISSLMAVNSNRRKSRTRKRFRMI